MDPYQTEQQSDMSLRCSFLALASVFKMFITFLVCVCVLFLVNAKCYVHFFTCFTSSQSQSLCQLSLSFYADFDTFNSCFNSRSFKESSCLHKCTLGTGKLTFYGIETVTYCKNRLFYFTSKFHWLLFVFLAHILL